MNAVRTPTATSEPFDAVIVGGGPRAVATALRLRSRLSAPTDEAPSEPWVTPNPVRIAIIDSHAVGTGATWLIDQPAEYLNNTQASATTVYPDASTPMSGPADQGPDLVEWAAQVSQAGAHPEGQWVVDEARKLTPDSFPTRRLQGVYFLDQLKAASEEALVTVAPVVGTAVDLQKCPGGQTAVVLEDGTEISAPTVVLAQGMVQANRNAEVEALAHFAEDNDLRYVEPGMPAERTFTGLPSSQVVLVRGLGANFFDVVGQLVADWGGATERVHGDPHGRLRYIPSGREARLVVGSRRGVPYRSKPDGGRFVAEFTPRWASPEWFNSFAGESGVDFARDLWPVLARELAAAYLAALRAYRPGAVAEGWIDALEHTDSAAQVDTALREAIRDPRWSWSVEELHRPTHGEPVSPKEWGSYVERLIADELGSMSDPRHHPRAAVNTAMSVLRKHVGRLAGAGVFHGQSFAADVLGWFDADALALASGPPSDRSRLVLALIEAGLIELLGPESTFEADPRSGLFQGTSPVTGKTVLATVLLETRMSKGKVPPTSDPLIRSLLSSGRARIHTIDGVPTDSMEATVAEISEDVLTGYNLVGSDGEADESVIVLGIPAQSTQPGSAIGAAPGVPSPLLEGADVAAKQILARRHIAARRR